MERTHSRRGWDRLAVNRPLAAVLVAAKAAPDKPPPREAATAPAPPSSPAVEPVDDATVWLTTTKAARLIGCSRQTILKWIKAKVLPARNVGMPGKKPQHLLHEDDVLALVRRITLGSAEDELRRAG